MRHHITIIVAVALAAAGTAQDTRISGSSADARWACCSDPSALPSGDPSKGEIPMPNAAAGWNAFHLFTSDAWRLHCVGAERLTGFFGSPQVIVLDEDGRCVILQSDSGKWTPRTVVEDGRACNAWASGDFDPRVEGPELYVGGASGNLHQVIHRGRLGWQTALVATIPGASVSKLVLCDLWPSRPGNEMLAFTASGPVWEILPPRLADEGFTFRQIGDLGSRARDAVMLPGSGERSPRVAVVLQSGEVALVTTTRIGFERAPLCHEPMSVARIARKPPDRRGCNAKSSHAPEVVYVARVDGLILRFSERDDGSWAREPIYAGPQGPRGLAAGRFDADPDRETVAVFGYSKKVQLLTRADTGSWSASTIYTDPGGGHWLAAGELDGRNATDELVGGGFSYHVFMVARVPGYGLDGVPTDPETGVSNGSPRRAE